MNIANKPKIRWRSGMVLFLASTSISFYLLNREDPLFYDFDAVFNFNGGLYRILPIFLFNLFLTGIFLASVYKTEEKTIKNKFSFLGLLKYNIFLFAVFFVILYLFFWQLYSLFPMPAVGSPPLPPTKIEILLSAIFSSFFFVLIFSFIPSVIWSVLFKKISNNKNVLTNK